MNRENLLTRKFFTQIIFNVKIYRSMAHPHYVLLFCTVLSLYTFYIQCNPHVDGEVSWIALLLFFIHQQNLHRYSCLAFS